MTELVGEQEGSAMATTPMQILLDAICLILQSGAVMNYYCFDGAGGYRNDGWNAASGCATMHSGQYEVNGCKLKVCDEEGCSEYNVVPDENGMSLDGEHYSTTNGC